MVGPEGEDAESSRLLRVPGDGVAGAGDRQQPEPPGASTLSPDPAWPSAQNKRSG